MPPLDELPNAYLALERENAGLRDEVLDLKRQLEWLRRQVFGAGRSETFDRQQLLLRLQDIEEKIDQAGQSGRQRISYERQAPGPQKRASPSQLYEKLPVKETVIIDPEEVKATPEDFERIGQESTFEVEITPPQLYKREIIRPKYRKINDREHPPVVAAAPNRPVAGGHASAGLLAWVAVAKYLDHIPLFRQERMFARQGVPIPRASLCEWIRIASEWLEPIYRRMHAGLIAGDYLQADETPIKCHDPDAGKGAVSQGYLWLISRPGADVVFDWRLSRRHGELTTLLSDFKGVLQSDAYAAYAEHASKHPAVVNVGCWAHARRRFVDAQKEDPHAVRVVLRLIGRLYQLEHQWDHADVDVGRQREPLERAQLRQHHFARSLKWLHALALSLRNKHRPKSGLGEASGYLLAQWPTLTRHIQHGQTRLDNNLVENAVRPTKLGLKNWLFVGHPGAGQRCAILYSIIVSYQCPDAIRLFMRGRECELKGWDEHYRD
ncbi:IS66 family transposase [Opitutaceae bacterium TAV4]|nr:IS66 family transposase [Opitutaceae bacterium TAV4]RRK02161.1 IS66 family transposase [Opitutaceae bacterium TAV3]